MQFSKDKRQETIIYLVLWGLLFIVPVMNLYIRAANSTDQTIDWNEVFMVWREYGVFFAIFLVHNHLLAPLLVYRQKRVLYFSIVVVLVALFSLYQCSNGPVGKQGRGPRHEMVDGNRPPMMKEGHRPPMMGEGHRPPEMADNHRPPEMADDHRPPMFDGERPPHKPDGKRPPFQLSPHDLTAIVVLILMLFANLGIKLYFKTRGDQKKLIALEKENLEQQLEYLKYQINPHFFMNTLNNIHALVDIDPEKAKDTILELSKMMRFVLYEGDKRGVPLNREFDFIRNYITLMRLRYTDKVKITVELPTETPDKLVPPLMLITFIENAFKHGISYQHESFIEVKVELEQEQLRFLCRNSKADKPNQEKGGVGLANVKQRLHLLYDNNFTLHIQDEPDIYNVELTIPLA